MSIESDLRAQLTASIKAKDLRKANVIRMVNSKVTERRTAKGFKGEVDDKLYLEVIAAYKKSIDKSREQFEAAGERGLEHLEQIDFESAYLATFLPEQLSDDAVRDAVKTAIAELGVTDPKMAGRVVGAVMKQHKGKVDANVVKDIATAELGG